MAKCKRNRNKTKRNFTVKTPTANQNYKDTVFRMLFSDRKNLLSLYNAVNQSDYNNPDDLEIVTLENAIYMGMKNDLAFIMDTNLYLYEHQSTYNPNMPLRDLFYICSEYQKLVDKKSLFSSTLQKIPAPNFIEFYNGSTVISDCTELRLSSAFECLTAANHNPCPALPLRPLWKWHRLYSSFRSAPASPLSHPATWCHHR